MLGSLHESSPLADPRRVHVASDEPAESACSTPVASSRPSATSDDMRFDDNFSADENSAFGAREHDAATAATDAGSCSASGTWGAAETASLASVVQSPAPRTQSATRSRAAAAQASAAAPAPAAELTAPAMDERAAKVFPLDASEPRASDMGAVANGQPSNQHTLFVWGLKPLHRRVSHSASMLTACVCRARARFRCAPTVPPRC